MDAGEEDECSTTKKKGPWFCLCKTDYCNANLIFKQEDSNKSSQLFKTNGSIEKSTSVYLSSNSSGRNTGTSSATSNFNLSFCFLFIFIFIFFMSDTLTLTSRAATSSYI